MANNLIKCFVKDKNIVTRSIAGETILVPVVNGVAEIDYIYTLNETGTRIWQFMDGRTPVNQIVEAIGKEYEVTIEEATKDVLTFVALLESAGMIQPSEKREI
jgi:hypothetical protein